MRLNGIKVVSFDAGGTLLTPKGSVGEVYAKVAAEQGVGLLDAAELQRGFVDSWKARRGFDYSREGWRELVIASFASQCAASVASELFEPIYRRFARAEEWTVFDDVLPTLRALSSAGYRLVVLSNWDERLRPLLGELQLAGHFERLFISGEHGWHKPDGRLFAQVRSEFKCNAGEILHVGDSHEEDVLGARAAGFQARHLDRQANDPPAGTIASLEALVPLLK